MPEELPFRQFHSRRRAILPRRLVMVEVMTVQRRSGGEWKVAAFARGLEERRFDAKPAKAQFGSTSTVNIDGVSTNTRTHTRNTDRHLCLQTFHCRRLESRYTQALVPVVRPHARSTGAHIPLSHRRPVMDGPSSAERDALISQFCAVTNASPADVRTSFPALQMCFQPVMLC